MGWRALLVGGWLAQVVHIPYLQGGVYPGIFLFTQAARMIRPTRQVRSGRLEMIGTLEQSNMAIR